jgi:DNA-binding transcriptional ArsR family regulator
MDIVTLGKSLHCPSRRTALALLEANGPLRVGELAARVGVSVSTMSFHVSRLEEAGLTVTRRCGRTTLVRPAWKRLALVGVRAR